MSVKDVQEAVDRYPEAKAVFVNNPTYYGICSNLPEIVEIAHAGGMAVLADEAHGTHFYFGEGMPKSAMVAGADMAGISMHKSGGSLTQSSILVAGPRMNAGHIRQIINLTQTTSGSYLLMSSLDVSRKNLVQNGKGIYRKVCELARYAREEINDIGDYYAYGRELANGDTVYDFDPTKLSVFTLDIGLAGIEVYEILRDEYGIQAEFGDVGNILAYLSIGDRERDIERLVSALSEIRRRYRRERADIIPMEYMNPEVVCTPQEAFYAENEVLPIEKSTGRICAESVMCYPPGIPMLSPGERVTQDILNYIRYMKERGGTLTGPEDSAVEYLRVLKGGNNGCG